jgi:hypothetical protein
MTNAVNVQALSGIARSPKTLAAAFLPRLPLQIQLPMPIHGYSTPEHLATATVLK